MVVLVNGVKYHTFYIRDLVYLCRLNFSDLNYLSAENIAKTFNDRWLFKDITLGISQGEKFALVGNNGVGKSTLLKILTGEIQTDAGKVSMREGIRTGFLTQQPHVHDSVTVKDVLFSDSNEVA